MQTHGYAKHVPAHIRVGRFVADEPRLSWVFPFLSQLPQTDVLVTGGTTRDAILGRSPKGVHILVQGAPEEVLSRWLKEHRVGSELDITLPTNHLWDNDERRLVPSSHHTLPLPHDLARRDASVNALAYSIRDGILHDPFNGLMDIERKTLRAIGNPEDRFMEDPRRITRFLRLASELGFEIDSNSWEALKSNAPSLNRLKNDDSGRATYAIPRVALGQEFLDALEANPTHALTLFLESGALNTIAPELQELSELESHEGRGGFEHVSEVLHHLGPNTNPTTLVAALLSFFEETAPEQARKLATRLHLPLVENDRFSYSDLVWLLNNHKALEETDPTTLSPQSFEKIFGGQRGENLIDLIHALHLASHRHSEARARLHVVRRMKEELLSTESPKLLRGRDLIAIGLHPGHHFRLVMGKVRDAQLLGKVSSREEALNFARHLMATAEI